MPSELMHAIVVDRWGGPEALTWCETPMPRPSADECLVKVEAAGVNFADLQMCAGRYRSVALPFIPGLEVAGVVAACGPAVTRFRAGDRIVALMGQGGYAEYATALEARAMFLPARWDAQQGAAFLMVFLTAYHALTTLGRLQAGESVLIHAAAGGVGSAAVQLAKAVGAVVLGTVSRPEKAERLRALSIDRVIDYSTGAFADDVLRATDDRGVDLVLDSVGGSVFRESLRCLAPRGRLVGFGAASGEPGQVLISDLQSKNLTVSGLGSTAMAREPGATKAALAALMPLVESERIAPVIGERFPLPEAAQAHALIASRRSVGKILLIPPHHA